jgi:hypothetical protein
LCVWKLPPVTTMAVSSKSSVSSSSNSFFSTSTPCSGLRLCRNLSDGERLWGPSSFFSCQTRQSSKRNDNHHIYRFSITIWNLTPEFNCTKRFI